VRIIVASFKIIIAGPAGVGKTTLRRVFFDHDNPLELLRHSLEPTVNVETTLYTFDSTIAIYDLAGQQLNSWLGESQNIFQDADAIICVLDCLTDWAQNKRVVERFLKIREQNCPKADILFLFHKIDLISIDSQVLLKNRIEIALSQQINIHYGLTSIAASYFSKTLQLILFFLQKYQLPINFFTVNENLLKMEILHVLSLQESIKIDSLFSQLKMPLFNFQIIIKKLFEQKLISQGKLPTYIIISELGKQRVNEIKNQISAQSGAIFPPYFYFKEKTEL
jgi:GTPase SAR1 family protein